jgi:hypothetical protein
MRFYDMGRKGKLKNLSRYDHSSRLVDSTLQPLTSRHHTLGVTRRRASWTAQPGPGAMEAPDVVGCVVGNQPCAICDNLLTKPPETRRGRGPPCETVT